MNDIIYAQWETEGGTTPEQNEEHFAQLAVSDNRPELHLEPDAGSREGNISAEVT